MIKSKRTFGVEIEASLGQYPKMNVLRSKLQRWRFDDDGSIRDLIPNPIEFVSPILSGATGEETLRKSCKVMKELGVDPNHTCCGLHVHLGAEDFKSNDEYIVLSEKDYKKFITSASNVKDIIDISFVNTEALVKYFRLTKKPLTIRYREHGFHLFNNLKWGSDTCFATRQNENFYVKFKPESIMGKVYQCGTFCHVSVNQEKKIREYYDKLIKTNKTRSKIVEARYYNASPDDASVFKNTLSEIKNTIHQLERQKVEDLYKLCQKSYGKYVVRVKSRKPTENLINLLLFYRVFDRVIMGMLPKDRREGNIYCSSLQDTFSFKEILDCKSQLDFESLWYKERKRERIERHKNEHYNDSRYHNVNFHSLFNRHGTVEIRSHGSTINHNRILLWTALHQHILDSISNGSVTRDEIVKYANDEIKLEELAYGMIKTLQLPDNLERYVIRLLNHFSSTAL